MAAHLLIDAATGGLLLAGARLLRRAGAKAPDWLPPAMVGIGEVAGAVLTERRPSDRQTGEAASAPSPPDETAPPSTPNARGGESPPAAPTHGTGEGLAASEPGEAGVPLAPAPTEAPGPSVTPPLQPESDVERAERIEESLAGAGAPQTGDTLVAQQEAAAAAEAGAIGGAGHPDAEDPAMNPVYEAGGGEQEGWEAAEADLVENATHGEGYGQPQRDAIAPELESDRASAVYGEADSVPSTEVVDDPGTDEADPGTGPGLASERGPTEPDTGAS